MIDANQVIQETAPMTMVIQEPQTDQSAAKTAETDETADSSAVLGKCVMTASVPTDDLTLIQRIFAAIDGYKTGVGIVLLFMAYAFTEHCRIWGIDVQAYTWINPLSETLDWWGQAFLLLGGGHKIIKNKDFFQSLFGSIKSNSNEQPASESK